MERKIIFISGGARSGKTSFAEKYAEQLAEHNAAPLYYLATSRKEDQEMSQRIKRHQRDRKNSSANWQTVEQPTDIERVVGLFDERAVVLVDCVTLLLTNELFQGDFDEAQFTKPSYQQKVQHKITHDLLALAENVHCLLIVSNEVLLDTVNLENNVVGVYQKLIGEIHQELVSQADEAYLIEAGIPIRKK